MQVADGCDSLAAMSILRGSRAARGNMLISRVPELLSALMVVAACQRADPPVQSGAGAVRGDGVEHGKPRTPAPSSGAVEQAPASSDDDPTREPADLKRILARGGPERIERIRRATALRDVKQLLLKTEAIAGAESTCARVRSQFATTVREHLTREKQPLEGELPACEPWSPALNDCAIRVLREGKFANRKRLDELWAACRRLAETKAEAR